MERGLDDAEGRVEAVEPELAHRHVGHRAEAHVGARHHVVGLDGEPEAMLVSQRLQMLRVVLDDQLLRRLPQVPQEALGHFQAVHHPARHGRQIAQRIVAAAAAEFLAEGGGPVLRAHLPTVDVQHRPARARGTVLSRPDLAQQRADERVEMRVQRGLVELVALQPQARQRRGPRVGAGAGAAKAQDGPLALPARPRPAGHRRPASRSGPPRGPPPSLPPPAAPGSSPARAGTASRPAATNTAPAHTAPSRQCR